MVTAQVDSYDVVAGLEAGADDYVTRIVKNADGEIIEERTFASHYIPYPNTYHYAPDVEPYDYSLVPEDPFN